MKFPENEEWPSWQHDVGGSKGGADKKVTGVGGVMSGCMAGAGRIVKRLAVRCAAGNSEGARDGVGGRDEVRKFRETKRGGYEAKAGMRGFGMIGGWGVGALRAGWGAGGSLYCTWSLY